MNLVGAVKTNFFFFWLYTFLNYSHNLFIILLILLGKPLLKFSSQLTIARNRFVISFSPQPASMPFS